MPTSRGGDKVPARAHMLTVHQRQRLLSSAMLPRQWQASGQLQRSGGNKCAASGAADVEAACGALAAGHLHGALPPVHHICLLPATFELTLEGVADVPHAACNEMCFAPAAAAVLPPATATAQAPAPPFALSTLPLLLVLLVVRPSAAPASLACLERPPPKPKDPRLLPSPLELTETQVVAQCCCGCLLGRCH